MWRALGFRLAWGVSKVLHLFADERAPEHYTSADAQRFLQTLTRRLGLDVGCIQPGYEDVWYYLWRERKLPVNVDPHDTRLDDELERARLRRVFDAGLAGVTGYVLPLARGAICACPGTRRT